MDQAIPIVGGAESRSGRFIFFLNLFLSLVKSMISASSWHRFPCCFYDCVPTIRLSRSIATPWRPAGIIRQGEARDETLTTRNFGADSREQSGFNFRVSSDCRVR